MSFATKAARLGGRILRSQKTTTLYNSRNSNVIFSQHAITSRRWLSDAKETAEKVVQDEKVQAETQKEETIPEETVDASDTTVVTEESELDKLTTQVKDLKNQLLRSLAEQENTRRIAKRDVDSARQFAIKSFAKSLLDTSDNLERALAAVEKDKLDAAAVTLYEGVAMTQQNLNKAFASNGLEKFGKVGEVFDPNQHEALYEYPDAEKTPGTVGQIVKPGFLLHKRVLRPAEVGVVKKG